jgi:hypothetical protein
MCSALTRAPPAPVWSTLQPAAVRTIAVVVKAAAAAVVAVLHAVVVAAVRADAVDRAVDEEAAADREDSIMEDKERTRPYL